MAGSVTMRTVKAAVHVMALYEEAANGTYTTLNGHAVQIGRKGTGFDSTHTAVSSSMGVSGSTRAQPS